MVDEIDWEDEEEEVEEDRGLPPLTCETPDLEADGWAKRDDGRPVKSDEAVVPGVAEEG